MNVYILPFSESNLGDNLLLGDEPSSLVWKAISNELAKKKIEVHTLDLFAPSAKKSDDVLIVLNHPEESVFWRAYYLLKYWLKHRDSRGGFVWKKRRLFYDFYRHFGRRILLQLESPTSGPTAYRILPKLAGLYTDIYLIAKSFGKRFGFMHCIYDIYNHDEVEKIIKKYFDRPKDKFLVMINANSAPHSLRNELYGERIKAVKFFSRYPDFDLYGPRWDLRPKHPFWLFRGGFIKKVWRGAVNDKWETLSRYKFALVFENCAYAGYVSEKIFDCLATGVVPVYLGAPDIETYVPGDCFIDARRFSSYEELNDFLRALTEKDLLAFRAAASDFFQKGKDRPFTKNFFVERFLEVLSPGLDQLGENSDAPLVSVVIPTYNDSRYLRGAIASVLGQTYKNLELIIADDGSTDNTKAIVHSFSDERIRYFYQENRGSASARNFGLEHCRGKYVALLDADDLFLPEKIKKHVSYLERRPECDFTYDEILFFRDEQPKKFWKVLIKHLSGFLKEDFIRMGGHCIGPSAAFFKRELFEKYGGFPDGWRRNEDYYFWLKLAVNGVYFQHLEEPLTLSRLRPQSLSSSEVHMKEAAELNLRIFDWLDNTLAQNDPARRYLSDFLSVSRRRLAFGYLILKDKKNGLRELKKWRYGWLLAPFFLILPVSLIALLLTGLRGCREKFLYREMAGMLPNIPPSVLH